MSFRSREFRAIKLLILAVAELRTRYPDSVPQLLAYSPTEAALAKQAEGAQSGAQSGVQSGAQSGTQSGTHSGAQNESLDKALNESPSKTSIESSNESSNQTLNESPNQTPNQTPNQSANPGQGAEAASAEPGLNEAEARQALRRWRQLHLVVGVRAERESEGTAISRLTGEEDVHDITDVNDIKREVDQFQPLEANFTGSLGSRGVERG